MKTNEKGSISPQSEQQGKDKHYSTTSKVLEIFKTGRKVTAYSLNLEVGFNDSRKGISLIREAGYPIRDYRLSDRRKVYYLPIDWKQIMEESKQVKNQLSLF